jgi:hypothetical protein
MARRQTRPVGRFETFRSSLQSAERQACAHELSSTTVYALPDRSSVSEQAQSSYYCVADRQAGSLEQARFVDIR